MSWLEKVKTDLTITTGDGASFTFLWVGARWGRDYNQSKFNYRNVEGTDVQRKQAMGRRYILTLYIQGDDHLERAEAFDTSAKDPRPWTVQHPYYGSLLVQPEGLTVENDDFNVSKLTIPVTETINETAPRGVVSVPDKITADKLAVDEALSQSYATDVQVKVKDQQQMRRNVLSTYNQGIKKVRDSVDTEKYLNAFSTANTFINDATSQPLAAMRQIQGLMNAPVRFADTVRSRLNTLVAQFNTLRANIAGSIPRNDKKLYEHNGGTMIGAIAETTVTAFTPADYSNRRVVLETIALVLQQHELYLADLDLLQSNNGGNPDSYIPDADSIVLLGQLVSLTVSNLFDVAANARQERELILEADSNWIMLAYRLYGLKPDDSTITELMDSNNATLDEHLGINKGRRIVYYV